MIVVEMCRLHVLGHVCWGGSSARCCCSMAVVAEVVRGAEMRELLRQGGGLKGGGRRPSCFFSILYSLVSKRMEVKSFSIGLFSWSKCLSW